MTQGSAAYAFRWVFRCLITLFLFLPVTGETADDGDISERYPGLAEAERPAKRSASCHELRANLRNLPELDRRVDLWVSGILTAMQTDGALWYVSLCLAPNIKVLCVTYQPNDMKVGDAISARGAYMRPDNNHIMLDPCLASSHGTDSEQPPGQK